MKNTLLKYGKIIPQNAELRRSLFSYDDGETVYPGFTRGETWNGWECPYFELEVVKTIPPHEEAEQRHHASLGLYSFGSQCLTWEEWIPEYEPGEPLHPVIRAQLYYRACATNTGIVEIDAEELKELIHGYNRED